MLALSHMLHPLFGFYLVFMYKKSVTESNLIRFQVQQLDLNPEYPSSQIWLLGFWVQFTALVLNWPRDCSLMSCYGVQSCPVECCFSFVNSHFIALRSHLSTSLKLCSIIQSNRNRFIILLWFMKGTSMCLCWLLVSAVCSCNHAFLINILVFLFAGMIGLQRRA